MPWFAGRLRTRHGRPARCTGVAPPDFLSNVGAATTDAQIRQVRFDRSLSRGGGAQRGAGSAQIEARPSCQNALSDLLYPHRPTRQKLLQVVGVGGEDGGFGPSGELSLGDSCEDGVDGVFVPV